MKLVNKNKTFELVNKGAMLVDMRSPVDFRDGTIKGAVNLPLRNFVNKLASFNKKQKIVIFGRNITDEDLKIAFNYAERLGFVNVFVTEYRQLADIEAV